MFIKMMEVYMIRVHAELFGTLEGKKLYQANIKKGGDGKMDKFDPPYVLYLAITDASTHSDTLRSRKKRIRKLDRIENHLEHVQV